MKVLIIIPAYNEAESIQGVINDLRRYVPNLDYVIVNDGSKDTTLNILEENNYNYIDGFLNLGLFGAVQTGFQYALQHNYDVAIQFDGDGQHPASAIPSLLQSIADGNDIAIGSRFVSEKKPFTARMLGSRLIAMSIRLVCNKKIKDPTSGLRAYNKQCILEYATDMNNPPEPDTLVYMLKKKRKIAEVQVNMKDREFGESYLNLSNTIKYMTRILVSIFLVQPFRKVK